MHLGDIPKMEKLILLDSNSIINRAYFALPPLSAKDGRLTNGVYGFTSMLINIIKKAEPSHIIAVFDEKAPTFRKKIYEEYKATRKGMPDELAGQLPILKELLETMGIKVVSQEGFEADDLIGTFAKACPFETIIVTGDRDSLQLIDDTTSVWLTKKGISEIEEYNRAKLLEEKLTPEQIVDLKSLMGDASDNIPGVAGIGEKSALLLLDCFKTLDGVYNNIENIKGKLKEKLVSGKEMAYVSYELAKIDTNVPIEYFEEDFKFTYPFKKIVRDMMEELDFRTLIKRVDFEQDCVNLDFIPPEIIDIKTFDELENLAALIKLSGECYFNYGENFNFTIDGKKEFIIKFKKDLFDDSLNYEEVFQKLLPLFLDSNIKKYCYDIKSLSYQLNNNFVRNGEDISLKAYLCNSNKNYKNILSLIDDFNIKTEAYASALFYLNKELDKCLEKYYLKDLYLKIELPLVEVLFDMEGQGISIDSNLLEELSIKFNEEIKLLTKQIYDLCGVEFNINSTKQLSAVLFETLNLNHGKKNKTGYSTDNDVLEGLKGSHPIIESILRYRELSKLQSTYIDGLRGKIDNFGKIHTIFKQNITATGRLSSTEPNLQNIPIRKPEGKILRKMFIASNNNKLVCADYSQIELRLLANFSGDEVLISSYENGLDIHAITASLVFDVDLKNVTSEMRRRAKAVNFGIIYGISDFGLANDIGVPVGEAKQFIKKYFETYPKVKAYMDNNISIAKEKGYISTLMGRIRFVDELKSGNYNIRSFGERIAMNMPLQGSSSDVIKLAMINVYNKLKEEKLMSKLILQVHDELILDCPIEEKVRVEEILKSCMENAVQLKVKLVAEVANGVNWYDAK